MKKTRLVSALAATVGAAILLAGCAGGGSMSGGGSSSSDVTWNDPTADLTGVTLTFGGGVVNDAGLKQVMDSFAATTHVTWKTVAYPDPYEQSLLTKVAVGDKPDLAAWQPTTSELTVLQPAKNLLSLDGAPWLDKLDPSMKDITGFLGKTRYAALITSPSVMGVYYNKDVFAKYGITDLPTDWASMVADAEKIKAAGGTAFFEAGGDQWPTQWWVQMQLAEAAQDGLWDRVNQNKEKFTDATILDAIKEYKSLIDEGLFNSNIKTASFTDQAKALLDGKAAMALQVNALLLQMQQGASVDQLNKSIGWFPISSKGTVATSIPDNKNGIVAFNTGDEKREAAARQFLNYWMTTDYADYIKAEKTVSIETSVPTPDGVPELATTISKSLSSSVGSMQSLAVANPDLYINLANMIQGTQTPEQVAETTQKQFAQLAQAQGVSGF